VLAAVTLVSAGGTQVQEVRGGGSYYSQNDRRPHFGLAKDTAVERVDECGQDSRTGRTDRVSQCDRAAIDIHARGVEGEGAHLPIRDRGAGGRGRQQHGAGEREAEGGAAGGGRAHTIFMRPAKPSSYAW